MGPLLVGANALVSMAETRVSSSVAAIVVASVPLWTAAAAVAAGERPGRREWLGVAGGIAGEAVPPRALLALALVVAGVVIVASRPRG